MRIFLNMTAWDKISKPHKYLENPDDPNDPLSSIEVRNLFSNLEEIGDQEIEEFLEVRKKFIKHKPKEEPKEVKKVRPNTVVKPNTVSAFNQKITQPKIAPKRRLKIKEESQAFSTVGGTKPRKVLPSVWKCSLGEILQANTRLSIVVRRILAEERKRLEEEKKKKAEEDAIEKAVQLKEEEEKKKEDLKRKEDNKRFGLNEDGTPEEKPPLVSELVSKTKQRRDKRKQNQLEREKTDKDVDEQAESSKVISRNEAEIRQDIEKIQLLHDSCFMNDVVFENRMKELNEELAPYRRSESIIPPVIDVEEPQIQPEEVPISVTTNLNTESEQEVSENIPENFISSELDAELLNYFSSDRGYTLETFLASLSTRSNGKTKAQGSKKKFVPLTLAKFKEIAA